MSQCDYNSKDDTYSLKSDSTTFVKIEGEWSKFLKFDDEIAWELSKTPYYDLLRMPYTLPSDATVRDDLVHLKYGREEEAEFAKIRLEEVQRRDRKLRAKQSGEKHH